MLKKCPAKKNSYLTNAWLCSEKNDWISLAVIFVADAVVTVYNNPPFRNKFYKFFILLANLTKLFFTHIQFNSKEHFCFFTTKLSFMKLTNDTYHHPGWINTSNFWDQHCSVHMTTLTTVGEFLVLWPFKN